MLIEEKLTQQKEKISEILDNYREKLNNDSLTLREAATTIGQAAADEMALININLNSKQTSYSNENITQIRSGAFVPQPLTEVYLPNVTSIGERTFESCAKLTSFLGSKVTSIGSRAFFQLQSLVELNLLLMETIPNLGIATCPKLTLLDFPKVTTISTQGLYNNTGLIRVNLPVCTSIGNQAFQNNSALEILYLASDTLCSLSNINAFSNSGISKGTGYIYVPSALIEDYKVATNWITYAAQFRAIEDYEDILNT